MRRIVSLAAWAALVLLWIAFVGTTTRQEVPAGLGAAVVAVAALEVVRAQGRCVFASTVAGSCVHGRRRRRSSTTSRC